MKRAGIRERPHSNLASCTHMQLQPGAAIHAAAAITDTKTGVRAHRRKRPLHSTTLTTLTWGGSGLEPGNASMLPCPCDAEVSVVDHPKIENPQAFLGSFVMVLMPVCY